MATKVRAARQSGRGGWREREVKGRFGDEGGGWTGTIQEWFAVR